MGKYLIFLLIICSCLTNCGKNHASKSYQDTAFDKLEENTLSSSIDSAILEIEDENIEEEDSETPLYEILEQKNSKRRRKLGLKLGFEDKVEFKGDTLDVLNADVFFPDKDAIYISYHGNYNQYFQVVSMESGREELLFTDTLESMNFVSDSIWDINYDGYEDIIINWYPKSGCCIANVVKIWLFDPATQTFVLGPELLNANYYSKQK